MRYVILLHKLQNTKHFHILHLGQAQIFNKCLVHLIIDVLKSSSNLESLFSFKFSAEKKSDLKEYKSLLLSFEALSLLS